MAGTEIVREYVFGLDIGTRSVVGTVGFMAESGRFQVLAQCVREHETRAMLDGQIHHIGKVSETIRQVKEALEAELGRELSAVCIAAAGRVLKTVTVSVGEELTQEREITEEDVYALSAKGVEQAYRELAGEAGQDSAFFCVGHSPMYYYMNGNRIGNLIGHRAGRIGLDMIATFLPADVIEGLYKAVELAGLSVSSLTLEPIAAITVAIPEKFRLLNIALVDVGAGTSDICITREGVICAYGMIPMAGDGLTEKIARHCLVEFAVAEEIKRALGEQENVSYQDILGLEHSVGAAELLELLEEDIDGLAAQAADSIRRLNGDGPVSAVFVVGGGGMIPGYTRALARELELPETRVAIRGQEVLGIVDFQNENAIRTPLMVTPVGICLNYFEQSNNFIFVSFNQMRLKLYDNGHLCVADAALQALVPNEALFPARGEGLTFLVNGRSRILRGETGEAAVITVNGGAAHINSPIRQGDVIRLTPSTRGLAAVLTLSQLPEYRDGIRIWVNGHEMSLPAPLAVNGREAFPSYQIQNGDDIRTDRGYTIENMARLLDIVWEPETEVYVNGVRAQGLTRVYEGFRVEWKLQSETVPACAAEGAASSAPSSPYPPLLLSVNGRPVELSGKREYVFADVFDHIDFDLKEGRGRSIATLHNGENAQYLAPLKQGDVLEIYWINQ